MADSGGNRGSFGMLLALVASVAIVGCGSSGGSSSSTASSTPAAPSETSSSTTSTTAAGANGTTAAGTKLQPGTPAIVEYQPGASSSSPTYRLQLTVVSIKQGSQSDFKGVELEKAQQGETPYYVTERIKNEGSGNVAAEGGNPAALLEATDDRGQQGQEVTILGTFQPCESQSVPKQFTKGVTYATCALYMVGGGGSIVSVSWTGNGADSYSEHPIVWSAQ